MPCVLIAPNAFKGSLSAGAAARSLARGLRDPHASGECAFRKSLGRRLR
ncbi:MAG: hypothetical protein AAB576_00395 [Elusimicrobiota bacterium]